MSKRHSWKKNPNHFSSLDLFSRNDAYSFPKKRFLEFWLDFFSKNDAYSFPGFWIFFQDSRIGVKEEKVVSS